MQLEKEVLIKKLYEKGNTLDYIEREAHCSTSTIYKVLDKYNIPKRGRNYITVPLDESKVCKMYLEGVIVSEIAKECRCSTNTISKILENNSIEKRSSKIDKKNNKDLSKYKNLSSPETQYWIGYICADGNIQYDTSKRNYKVSLFSKDEEVINNYVNYFGKDTVCIHKRKSGVIEAYVCSKELCKYFMDVLNIHPNKTLNLDPNIEFSNSFILGYFDGDGCIRNSKENQKRYECNITSGSKEFLNKIKEILDDEGIYSILYKHTDCNAYKIRIDKKSESEKFYKFLYKNKIPCLSRKLNNFVHLFGNL